MFNTVKATDQEVATPRAGDKIVPVVDVIMNRAFTVPGQPTAVWPWIVQLGKQRAGWYLPARVESFLPAARRASRTLEPQWLNLKVGDIIPDYGRSDATFEVVQIGAPNSLVYRSTRGHTTLSWSITLEPAELAGQTRVCLRLRLAPVRNKWLANTAGELLDMSSIAAMAAGLRERLPSQDSGDPLDHCVHSPPEGAHQLTSHRRFGGCGRGAAVGRQWRWPTFWT